MPKFVKESDKQKLEKILIDYKAFLAKQSRFLSVNYHGEYDDMLSQCTLVFIEAYFQFLRDKKYNKRHLLNYCLRSVINFRKVYVHAKMSKTKVRYKSYVIENDFVSYEDIAENNEMGLSSMFLVSSNDRPEEKAEINEIIDYVFVNLQKKEKEVFKLLLNESSLVIIEKRKTVKLNQKKIAELCGLSRPTTCRIFAKIKELILSY